jgi:hypothetical protein
MDALKKIQRWWSPSVGTASFAGGLYVRDWLKTSNVPDGLSLVILFVGIFLIMRMGQWFIETIIDSSKAIRFLLLQKDFVEGEWVEVCIDPKTNTFAPLPN